MKRSVKPSIKPKNPSKQLKLELKVNYAQVIIDYKEKREAYFKSIGK